MKIESDLARIGEEIRAAQARSRASNTELAQRAGVNRNTLSALRMGRSVSMANLLRVVAALGGQFSVEFDLTRLWAAREMKRAEKLSSGSRRNGKR